MARQTTGIRKRHSRECAIEKEMEAARLARKEGREPEERSATCNCKPAWEASVYSKRDRVTLPSGKTTGKKIRRVFTNLDEAKSWRHDAASEVGKGTRRAPSSTTLREAAEAFLTGVENGTVTTRSGDPYKPGVVREYRRALEKRILPELGAHKLTEITRVDVQDFADRLRADGLDPSTVRNVLMPLRAIFRRALARGQVAINPTTVEAVANALLPEGRSLSGFDARRVMLDAERQQERERKAMQEREQVHARFIARIEQVYGRGAAQHGDVLILHELLDGNWHEKRELTHLVGWEPEPGETLDDLVRRGLIERDGRRFRRKVGKREVEAVQGASQS